MEVTKRRFFVGIEKGIGKYEDDMLMIMNEDRTDIGSKWIRGNDGERLNFVQDKQCESSV